MTSDPLSEPAPLAYRERTADPLLPLIRLVLLAALAESAFSIVSTLTEQLYGLWDVFLSGRVVRQTMPTWILLIFVPAFAGSTMIVIGAAQALRFRAQGCLLVVAGAIACIVGNLLSGGVYRYIFFRQMPTSFSTTQFAYEISTTGLSAFQSTIFPLFIALFLRNRSVREVFDLQ